MTTIPGAATPTRQAIAPPRRPSAKPYADSIGLKVQSLCLVLKRDVADQITGEDGPEAALDAASEMLLALRRAREILMHTVTHVPDPSAGRDGAARLRVEDIVKGAYDARAALAAVIPEVERGARSVRSTIAQSVVSTLASASEVVDALFDIRLGGAAHGTRAEPTLVGTAA
jgi:hypothetical protein